MHETREDRRLRPRRRGGLSLLPLLLLVLLMGGIGWGAGDFSQIPMTIVFLFTSVAALFTPTRLFRRRTSRYLFSGGRMSKELLLMVWIFVGGCPCQVRPSDGSRQCYGRFNPPFPAR